MHGVLECVYMYLHVCGKMCVHISRRANKEQGLVTWVSCSLALHLLYGCSVPH